ncbi:MULTISPECIES: hypothetical protein [unclassified Streptomyces]|jgi:hypothetical protein|uniref:hypothetical protein n=1 Tax=unclassified Streptomyces TaxID=2593676 RepID=UPI0033248AC4
MNSSRTQARATAEPTERAHRTRTARGPWAVLCAVATVVLGPAAATASALDQANAAPLHHVVRAEQPQAYLPADSLRRRSAG